jgi:Leucine-rich repeat (LRR) protein
MSNSWPYLEYLDASDNEIEELPAAICKLIHLRKLYINDNKLTFNGMPKSLGKLERLTVMSAANNLLENIPESLCRCGQLKRLYLTNNRLVTLPDTIHYLKESLDVFDINGNPNLVLPPKPVSVLITGHGATETGFL